MPSPDALDLGDLGDLDGLDALDLVNREHCHTDAWHQT